MTTGKWVNVDDVLDKPSCRRLARAANGMMHARLERDMAIRDAHRAGMTLREIGKYVGLTHVAVLHILRAAPADGSAEPPEKP